jgi:tetratricopeptide (TPR) repeat protein
MRRGIRLRIAVVLTIWLMCSSTWGDEPALGRSEYLRGLTALGAGRTAEAVTELTKAIQADSENADYYMARGAAGVMAEKLPGAIKDLERALRLAPGDKSARLWMAVAVAMTGDFARGSEIYPFATHDLDESRLRQASHDYGDPVFRQKLGEPDPDGPRKQAAARKELLAGARWWVAKVKARPELARAVAEQSQQQMADRDNAAALVELDSALAAAPEDPDILVQHATCLLNLGDAWKARGEFTQALTIRTDYVQAYLGRALAAAQMGDAARVKSDLAVAAALSPDETEKQRSAIEAALREASAQPRVTREALLERARLGGPVDGLVDQAFAVYRSANRDRRRYDETYQDRLRELEAAVKAGPRDAEAQAALGRFLLDESSVRRERVGPRGPYRNYRYQTEAGQRREVERAEQCADASLGMDPNVLSALVVKAKARMWHQQFGDAEKLVRRALTLDDTHPDVLEMFAEVLQVAAAQRSAEAAELRRPKYMGSHDERVGDYIYTYTRYLYPSSAERAEAAELDKQAELLAAEALATIDRAAQVHDGEAVGHYFRGVHAWRTGNLPQARQSYEAAVKMQPENVLWRFNLAGVYAGMGEDALASAERLKAVNLVETTTEPLLNVVWDHVARTKWRSAREALTAASEIDPADPRVWAYLGVAYEGEERLDEALACYRAALALEESRGRLSGRSLGVAGEGSLRVDDYGLSATVRRRAAKLLTWLERYDEAAELELASVANQARVPQADWAKEVYAGMLPDPEMDPNVVPEAENVMALFAWSRVGAGTALAKGGKLREAIDILKPIAGYELQMTNGLGADRLHGPRLYAAVELCKAYLELGDLNQAEQYARLLPRKRFGTGPSKGPFPELEAEGSALQERVAQLRQGRQAVGDETSEEWNPPEEERVQGLLRQIGPKFGHPELGNGSRRFAGDAREQQLCAAVEQAVRMIATPKSTRWREDALLGLAMLQQVEANLQQQAELLKGRAGNRPVDPRRDRGRQQLVSLETAIKHATAALTAVRDLAVQAGYPAEQLEQDLAAGAGGIRQRPRGR